MDAVSPEDNQDSMRERELQVEVARLNAELAVLKGGGEPTEIAARFLTMAANTVDQAMADARREADELAVEVTAEAEARRDEATRVAEEVEAQTEALRMEAEQHQALTVAARTEADAAREEAERMRAAATEHINAERARVADEVERLAEVRSALESERSALETYHDELKRRVQELAESMVSFMTTEPPLAAVAAIDELAAPAIAPAAAAVEAAFAYADTDDAFAHDGVSHESAAAHDATDVHPEAAADVEPAAPDVEAAASDDVATHDEVADEVAAFGTDMPADDESAAPTPFPEPEVAAVVETDPAPVFETDPAPVVENGPAPVVENGPDPEAFPEPTSVPEPRPETHVDESEMQPDLAEVTPLAVVPPVEDDEPIEPIDADAMVASIFERDDTADEPTGSGLFASATAAPVPATPVEPADFYDAPQNATVPSFTEMLSGAVEPESDAEFGGVPVVDDVEAVEPVRKKGGLFSRIRSGEAEVEVAEPVLPEAAPVEGGLFGSHASRLIEQTSPEQLASALADDSAEDARFRSFLDGDGDNDPSRDWLLRPDED